MWEQRRAGKLQPQAQRPSWLPLQLHLIALPPRPSLSTQVVRKGGLRSTLLHNTVGAGDWDVLVMQALVGMGAGGRPISLSLLPQPEPAADPAAAAAAAEALGHGHGLVKAAAAKQAAAVAEAAAAAGRPATAPAAAAAAQEAPR